MDAIIESPERLLIGVLRSAVDAGAVAASYVEARSICPRDGGVTVRAMADGEGPFTIRTRLVLDARGPWTNRALVRGEDDASSASAVHMESDSKARISLCNETPSSDRMLCNAVRKPLALRLLRQVAMSSELVVSGLHSL